MKTIKQFSIMMAFVLLSFNINYGQEPSPLEGHTITLNVDTDNINQQNIDSTCNFGQTDGGSNADYTTVVALGDEITWEGRSINGNDKVKIVMIKYVNGADILNNNELKNSLFSRKVNGQAIKGMPGDIEKYSISFKIAGNNETFIIDPKIQVN